MTEEEREPRRWLIPSRIVEYRLVAVEGHTLTEAMANYRQGAWVEGPDPDPSRYEVYKVGAAREEP